MPYSKWSAIASDSQSILWFHIYLIILNILFNLKTM